MSEAQANSPGIETARRLAGKGDWAGVLTTVAPLLAQRKPDVEALLLAGLAEIEAGDAAVGLRHLEAAHARSPAHAGVALNLGIVYRRLARPRDAVAVMREAAMKGARDLALLINLVQAQLQTGDLGSAERMLQRALDHAPREGALLLLKVKLLRMKGRFSEAEVLARHCVADFPGAPDFEVELGALEVARDECAAAASRLDGVLKRHPDFVPAQLTALLAHFRLRNFERVFALRAGLPDSDPQVAEIDGSLLSAEMTACEWDRARRRFEAQIADHGVPLEPFLATHLVDDPAMVLSSANRFAADLPQRPNRRAPPKARDGGRIRVGYLSSDFRMHPVGFLMQDLVALHDRGRFDVIGLSTWPSDESPVRRHFERHFDTFVDMIGLTVEEAAASVAAQDLDILVDLNGHTMGRASRIVASYPAPIQVTWLGYPGTFGGKVFDYAVADAFTVPDLSVRQFSESVVRLPDTYQPNTAREPAPGAATRAEFGLPENAVVFCSFNDPRKISRAMVASWARILHRVPDGHFWIYVGNVLAGKNVAAAFAEEGIDPGRVHFAPLLPFADHFRRLPVADLFLDTYPYSGHTTCSDALAMGLPVLTLPGAGMGSRVAASLVTLHGFPELVAADMADYEARAVALAADRQQLAALKARVAAAVPTSKLFDSRRFTRHLESAYETMVARHRSGQPARPFDVAVLDA